MKLDDPKIESTRLTASSKSLSDQLLANHVFFQTDRVERMNDMLLENYGGRIVSVDRGVAPFYGQVNRVRFKDIGFATCAYDNHVEIDFSETAAFRQLICLNGCGETIMQRKASALSDAASCVIPPELALTARYDAGYRQLLLQVDPTALRRKLMALVGDDLPRPIEFRLAQTCLAPQAEMLKRLAVFFAHEADILENEACRLARDELEQALLTAFLSGNAHSYSYLLQAPPQGLAPRQVWLAESYIEANWDKPLTIDALAMVVGVSARSIFKAFKDHRGYSPMTFLKDVRLRRAREMLSLARPADSVTAVAYRCGYQNHGYFAREYRARFGESPSTTLARSRRARLA